MDGGTRVGAAEDDQYNEHHRSIMAFSSDRVTQQRHERLLANSFRPSRAGWSPFTRRPIPPSFRPSTCRRGFAD